MFQRTSIETIGFTLLILALTLVTATLAMAGEIEEPMPSPTTISTTQNYQCAEAIERAEQSFRITIQTETKPNYHVQRGRVTSLKTGSCEAERALSAFNAFGGTTDIHILDASGRNCVQEKVSFTLFRDRKLAASSYVTLTIGDKSFNCIAK